MTKSTLAVLSLLALAANGCVFYEYDEGWDDTAWAEPSSEWYGDDAVDVRGSVIAGDVGDVTNFRGAVWLEQGYSGPGFASVEIQARNEGRAGAVMNMVSFEGGLDHPDLVPGAVLRFSRDDFRYGEASLHVSVLGCSGSQPNDWEYDDTADQVEVRVVDPGIEGYIQIDYVATFSHRGRYQTIEGSFQAELVY